MGYSVQFPLSQPWFTIPHILPSSAYTTFAYKSLRPRLYMHTRTNSLYISLFCLPYSIPVHYVLVCVKLSPACSSQGVEMLWEGLSGVVTQNMKSKTKTSAEARCAYQLTLTILQSQSRLRRTARLSQFLTVHYILKTEVEWLPHLMPNDPK